MVIEKSGFLLMAGMLAAGGVGGWLAHDAKTQRERPHAEPAPTPVAAAMPSSTALTAQPRVPPPPSCDDSVGTPEECPAMGPADEGVCTNFAAKRCAEYKATFKPKVAQAAVACLKALKGNAACDPARVNLCGHSALMAACPEPTRDPNDTEAAATPPSPVVSACDSIVKGCSGQAQAIAPTLADCRQTLSGMTDFGRASMVECMASHCGDKGLLGCEGSKKP